MALEVPPELARLLSRAFTSGAETSIQELALLLELGGSDALSAALGVADFVSSFQLDFDPPVAVGELGTPRVLRSTVSRGDDDDLSRIIERGEGPTAEFKSSLVCSMRDWVERGELVGHPSLAGEVLKTICAFLNSYGGDLLIGVDDAGRSCGGVLQDMAFKKWDLDRWQLELWALINGRFVDSALVSPFVRLQMVEIDGAPVAHLSVLARDARTFVKRDPARGVEFFVRNGSRTDSLDLPAFYAHMTARLEARAGASQG